MAGVVRSTKNHRRIPRLELIEMYLNDPGVKSATRNIPPPRPFISNSLSGGKLNHQNGEGKSPRGTFSFESMIGD